MESSNTSHKMSPDALSKPKHWPRWPGSWLSCELEIFYPLGGQKQTTYSFVPKCAYLDSHTVAFINSIWLSVGSDRSLKERSFLNCNLKNQELKLRRKDKCWESNNDFFKSSNWGEWLMLTELKAPSCGSE